MNDAVWKVETISSGMQMISVTIRYRKRPVVFRSIVPVTMSCSVYRFVLTGLNDRARTVYESVTGNI